MDPSVEEKEILEEDIKEEVEDEAGKGESDEVEENRDDDGENKEVAPQAADGLEKNKQSEPLNLNNEVVNLRKEVKRVRVLIIRKLTRHIGALKKKKGKEMEIERNQQRAARLLEEIHAMKALVPDVVG